MMSRRSIVIASIISFLALIATDGTNYVRSAFAVSAKEAEHQAAAAKRESQQKNIAEELQGIEKRRQQLMEKEAALASKEQEIARASASLDAKIKELSAAQKALEDAANEKKKKEAEYASERYKKMIKLLKGMKPEDSAKLVDKLDQETAIGALDQMDQKTVIKMSKFINQPRLIRWLNDNLKVPGKR
jgi:flagellar motility protein MotE (MotC chaperone)